MMDGLLASANESLAAAVRSWTPSSDATGELQHTSVVPAASPAAGEKQQHTSLVPAASPPPPAAGDQLQHASLVRAASPPPPATGEQPSTSSTPSNLLPLRETPPIEALRVTPSNEDILYLQLLRKASDQNNQTQLLQLQADQAERERHHTEVSLLRKRLADAEEHSTTAHEELQVAKQDRQLLSAARRRVEELERSQEHNSQKLSHIIEAESLNQQKHELLFDTLDAERRHRAHLEDEVERMRTRHDELLEAHEALKAQHDALRARHDTLKAEHDELRGLKTESDKLLASKIAARAARRLRLAGVSWAWTSWQDAVDHQYALARRREWINRFARRIRLAGVAWAWNTWMDACAQRHVFARQREWLRRFVREWLDQQRGYCFSTWKDQYNLNRSYTRYMAVARRTRLGFVRDAWNVWAATMRSNLRHLARHPPLAEAQLAELTRAVGTLGLEELLAEIRALETQRAEERARLEAEVAAIGEALRLKRDACDRLKRANALVVAQFEAAEGEFLQQERRRLETAPTTVVGRLVEAVFGEPLERNESVRAAVHLDQRGEPLDRMAIIAYRSDQYAEHEKHRALGGGRSRRTAHEGSYAPAHTRTRSSAQPTTTNAARAPRSGTGASNALVKASHTPYVSSPTRARLKHTAQEAREIAAAVYGRALIKAEKELKKELGVTVPPFSLLVRENSAQRWAEQ